MTIKLYTERLISLVSGHNTHSNFADFTDKDAKPASSRNFNFRLHQFFFLDRRLCVIRQKEQEFQIPVYVLKHITGLCCEFTYVLSLIELSIFAEYLLDLHNISKYPLGA